jgi:hypothetical protein
MRQARRRTFQGQTMVYARHERFTKCVQAFKILVELFYALLISSAVQDRLWGLLAPLVPRCFQVSII